MYGGLSRFILAMLLMDFAFFFFWGCRSITVSTATFVEDNDGFSREILGDCSVGVRVDGRGDNRVSKATTEETIQCPTEAENSIDGRCMNGSDDIMTNSSDGGVPSKMVS